MIWHWKFPLPCTEIKEPTGHNDGFFAYRWAVLCVHTCIYCILLLQLIALDIANVLEYNSIIGILSIYLPRIFLIHILIEVQLDIGRALITSSRCCEPKVGNSDSLILMASTVVRAHCTLHSYVYIWNWGIAVVYSVPLKRPNDGEKGNRNELMNQSVFKWFCKISSFKFELCTVCTYSVCVLLS